MLLLHNDANTAARALQHYYFSCVHGLKDAWDTLKLSCEPQLWQYETLAAGDWAASLFISTAWHNTWQFRCLLWWCTLKTTLSYQLLILLEISCHQDWLVPLCGWVNQSKMHFVRWEDFKMRLEHQGSAIFTSKKHIRCSRLFFCDTFPAHLPIYSKCVAFDWHIYFPISGVLCIFICVPCYAPGCLKRKELSESIERVILVVEHTSIL